MRFKGSQFIPWVAIAMVLMCAAHQALAQATPPRSLLALSKRNHTLAIVDPTTLR